MSNKKQSQHRPEFSNRLCKAVGHDWRTTTDDDYRVCQRDDCHTCQHRVNGRWENALPSRSIGWIDALEAEQKRTALPQQQALF